MRNGKSILIMVFFLFICGIIFLSRDNSFSKLKNPMLIKRADAKIRKSENIEIHNYVTRDFNESFSLSLAILEGDHPKTRNEASDRAYYIIEGTALVNVGDSTYQVESDDVVFIPKNIIHSIKGTVKYIIINSPSFNPSTEKAP